MQQRPAKGHGCVAAAVRDSDRRDAIDRSLLDRRIRHSGTSRFGRVPGECPGHEESAGAQNRRAGESVVDEAAHLWAIAKFVSYAPQKFRTQGFRSLESN